MLVIGASGAGRSLLNELIPMKNYCVIRLNSLNSLFFKKLKFFYTESISAALKICLGSWQMPRLLLRHIFAFLVSALAKKMLKQLSS